MDKTQIPTLDVIDSSVHTSGAFGTIKQHAPIHSEIKQTDGYYNPLLTSHILNFVGFYTFKAYRPLEKGKDGNIIIPGTDSRDVVMAASGKRDGTSDNAASPLLGNAEHTARDWNLQVSFYIAIQSLAK
jgi:hypothetical protein